MMIWVLPLTVLPPMAPPIEYVETRHGEKIVDNYFWLRNKKDPSVQQYLNAENQYFAEVMKPRKKLFNKLQKELFSREIKRDQTFPIPFAGYYYWSETLPNKEEPVFYRRKGLKGKRELVVDLNKKRQETGYASLGDSEPHPTDSRYHLYSVDLNGHRDYLPFLIDFTSGETLPLPFGPVSSLLWGKDADHIIYIKENTAKRPYQLYQYQRSTGESKLLLEQQDESLWFWAWSSLDGKYLMVGKGNTESSSVLVAPIEHPDRLKEVEPLRRGIKYNVSSRGSELWVVSNHQSDDYGIYRCHVDSCRQRDWKVVMAPQAGRKIEDLSVFANHAVYSTREQGVIRLYRLVEESVESGVRPEPVRLPEEVYHLWSSWNPSFETSEFYFNYTSLLSPRTLFQMDLKTGSLNPVKTQAVPGKQYRPKDFESQRIWVTARDGTRVPVSLVYKRTARQKGPAPMFLTGYGSYGHSFDVSFSATRLSMLDRGVIYAIAHVRGGGELGEQWRKDGKFLKKKNTFTDFIDVAEFFIREGWTRSDLLAIEGGSAGGLLMGAVVNMRPDLARVVHAAVPFVDVVNTMWDESLPLTTQEFDEWGNPKDKKFYEYIKSYCPYSNLKPEHYPSMLVTSSINDSQVPYWEAAKYVAKMRAMKQDKNPLVLRMSMGQGHGGASGRYESLTERAQELAFILGELGIKK